MDVSLNKVESEEISEYKERCLRIFIKHIEVHFILRHKYEVLYSDDLIDEKNVPPVDLIGEKNIPYNGSLLCITKDKVFYCFSRSNMVGKLKFYRYPLKNLYEFISNSLTNHIITRSAIWDLIRMDELPVDLPTGLKNRIDRLKELKQAGHKEAKNSVDFLNDHYEGMSQLERHRDMMTQFESGNFNFLKKVLPKNNGFYDYAEESSSEANDYLALKIEGLIQSDITKKINRIIFNEKK